MNSLIQKKIIITLSLSTMFTYIQAETIAAISGQKVMTESETGKAMQLKIQEEQKKLAGPLQADGQKIQELEKKLIADKELLEKDFAEFDKIVKTLSTEDKEQKAETLRERAVKFDDKKRELDRMVQKIQAEAHKIEMKLSELQQKEMAKLDALVRETSRDLAQKNNWDIVIMEEHTLYVNPKSLKTNIVIEEIDKKTKAQKLEKKQSLEKKSLAKG